MSTLFGWNRLDAFVLFAFIVQRGYMTKFFVITGYIRFVIPISCGEKEDISYSVRPRTQSVIDVGLRGCLHIFTAGVYGMTGLNYLLGWFRPWCIPAPHHSTLTNGDPEAFSFATFLVPYVVFNMITSVATLN